MIFVQYLLSVDYKLFLSTIFCEQNVNYTSENRLLFGVVSFVEGNKIKRKKRLAVVLFAARIATS